MLDELFPSVDGAAPFNWDQYLVDDVASPEPATLDTDTTPASAILILSPSEGGSPASDAAAASPRASESEHNTTTLDLSKSLGLFDFDFDLPANAGITHDPTDVLASLRASTATPTVPAPDVTLSADPTVLSTFGSTRLTDFGGMGSLGANAVNQLQLGSLLSQLTATTASLTSAASDAVSSVSNASSSAPTVPGLNEAYAALGWPSAAAEKEQVAVALESAPMKRKISEVSDDLAVKRPRGRPASSAATPSAKRAYRRQSKNGLSLSQLAAAVTSGSPVVVDDKFTPGSESPDESETASSARRTSTGKLSTARPKAVVPEKYMKNGEAQTITGMTTEQILSFPNWEALMEQVDAEHHAGAEVFGKMITENRDKAKWAAKKSRDERKQKVETLEAQVDDLNGKIAQMRGVLLGLVGRGLVSLSEVESYI